MSKRIFSTHVIESDAFLDMPLTAQALYVHLNMNADNDGFVNPKKIMRMIGAAHDDLQILIAKRFLIVFDSGVVVIKHWWINNTKRHDRHVPTNYLKEVAMLVQKDNKSYKIITTQEQMKMGIEEELGNQMATTRQPLVASMQYNSRQYNTIQTKQTATKKGFVKNEKIDKKSYAKAAEADRQLEKKENEARTRKPSEETGYKKAKSIADALKNKKL